MRKKNYWLTIEYNLKYIRVIIIIIIILKDNYYIVLKSTWELITKISIQAGIILSSRTKKQNLIVTFLWKMETFEMSSFI